VALAERSGDSVLDLNQLIEFYPKRRRRFALPAHSKTKRQRLKWTLTAPNQLCL
jgi:hypothetical protein